MRRPADDPSGPVTAIASLLCEAIADWRRTLRLAVLLILVIVVLVLLHTVFE